MNDSKLTPNNLKLIKIRIKSRYLRHIFIFMKIL